METTTKPLAHVFPTLSALCSAPTPCFPVWPCGGLLRLGTCEYQLLPCDTEFLSAHVLAHLMGPSRGSVLYQEADAPRTGNAGLSGYTRFLARACGGGACTVRAYRPVNVRSQMRVVGRGQLHGVVAGWMPQLAWGWWCGIVGQLSRWSSTGRQAKGLCLRHLL